MNFSGGKSAAMLALTFFFEGPIFGLVFAMGIRGMGRHTKDASALITAAISGGAVLPGISFVVYNAGHRTVQYSMCVAVAGFAAGSIYPIFLNLSPLSRAVVDPIADPSLLAGPARRKGNDGGANGGLDDSVNDSRVSITSRALSLFSLRKKRSSPGLKTEWREHKASVDSSSPPHSAKPISPLEHA